MKRRTDNPALASLAGLFLICCNPETDVKPEGPTAAPDQVEAAIYARAALEDEAWCRELQKRPGLAEHLGEPTFTDEQSLKPAKDQCAYYGEDGSVEMRIVAVAENAAVAEVLFDALTTAPPEKDSTPSALADLRAERIETLGARLEALAPTDPEGARTQLEDSIGQALHVGIAYEAVEGIADRAAIQTQYSKAMDLTVRYLYVREGNAILMFLTRPQGEHAPWEDAYRRLRGALPDVLSHVGQTLDAH